MRGSGDKEAFSTKYDRGDTEPAWLATQEILDESRSETKRFLWFALIPVALLIGTGLVLFYTSENAETASDLAGPALQSESAEEDLGANEDSDSATNSDSATDGEDGAESATDSDSAANGEDGADTADTATVTVLPAPPTDAAYIDATLSHNVFVLSGRVPDEETKQALEARAELAYAPFFTSEVEVDDSITPTEWLAVAPEVVGLLPMITDGTIRLQDDAIAVAGRSPTPEYAANFQGALSMITGLPVATSAIEITDLLPPKFYATVTNGEVLLEGEIPSEAIGQTFIQGAAAVYGPENVSSNMTINEGTYTSFWMYTMPGVFQLFHPFSTYEIQVVDGITSGAMQGGVLFELNSSDIGQEAGQVLAVGVALLVRDRSLEMTVVGHTDSQGPADLNQELSLQRAQTVVQFLVENGVPRDRLNAEGKGSAEPIASNDDEEGRALNRRVEFRFD